MGNKKNKMLITVMVACLVTSIGLFVVQNFFLKDAEPATVQIYRTTRQIAPYTALTPDMFEAITVREDVSLPGAVKNLAIATDGLHYAGVTIESGTYLTEGLITQDNKEANLIYTMEVNANFVADVAYNDVIDIYTLNKDNQVSPLFLGKKLYKGKTESIAGNTTTTATQYEVASKMYIKVTQKEMMDYYTSLRDYRLIVLPYVPQYAGDAPTTYVPTPDEVDPWADEDVITPAGFDYPVSEGETYETIADTFGVDIEVLKATNNNVVLEPGMSIIVPEAE